MLPTDENEEGNEIPDILIQIWENWQSQGGHGTCDGCAAHWNRRTDLPDQPGERTSSYGLAPYYGQGDFDAELAVLGREPGPHDETEENPTELTFSERYQPDITEVAKPSHETLHHLEGFFNTLDQAEIQTYWTQLRKCNQYPNEADIDEDPIRERCCGLGTQSGYLQQELEVVGPDYVISLGRDATTKLLELFDVSVPYSNFSEFTLSGNDKSGFNPITDQNLPFTVIPTAHPSQGWTWVGSRLDSVTTLDERGINSKKEHYEAVAEDFLEYQSL